MTLSYENLAKSRWKLKNQNKPIYKASGNPCRTLTVSLSVVSFSNASHLNWISLTDPDSEDVCHYVYADWKRCDDSDSSSTPPETKDKCVDLPMVWRLFFGGGDVLAVMFCRFHYAFLVPGFLCHQPGKPYFKLWLRGRVTIRTLVTIQACYSRFQSHASVGTNVALGFGRYWQAVSRT